MRRQLSQALSQYLSEIGRRGGMKSRRTLDPDTAKRMVRIREARRLFKKYHARCFWSYDRNYRIEAKDLPWVAHQLMKHGDRTLWLIGRKLCP